MKIAMVFIVVLITKIEWVMSERLGDRMDNVKKKDYIAEFKKITIEYKMKNYSIKAVNQMDLKIKSGKITALVGESGSGKTTAATALLNCLSAPGEVTSGEVVFYGGKEPIDIILLNDDDINAFRWKEVSMVFQGAQSSLNPITNIFEQFYETMRVHDKTITKQKAIETSRYYLDFVNLDADRIMASFPHELSGGMKQRVMIAFSLLLEPKLIILDEPTTALDVITQDFIFRLLKKINLEKGISMLLLTHDISVVAKYADYMGVMYGGSLMEYSCVEDVFGKKMHPYTKGLMAATPSLYKNIEDMCPIEGSPPNMLDIPSGCVFHPRCKDCMEICKTVEPIVTINETGHLVKCHLYSESKGVCK